jgi:hypothetical protein
VGGVAATRVVDAISWLPIGVELELAVNPGTGLPMSKEHMRRIFRTRCFDETEDDPWQWLTSPAQDFIPAELKPLRVACAEHILANMRQGAWFHQVAIDPCSSLLPKTARRSEEQKVAAMGAQKWMSKGSSRKGPKLRAPSTAKKQAGGDVTQVHWTPVLARDKCDFRRGARRSWFHQLGGRGKPCFDQVAGREVGRCLLTRDCDFAHPPPT